MKTTSSEITLFNHEEFGEAYLGMAYHVREMNQLDRMIFEDCAVADGAGGHGGSSPPRRMVDSTIALVVAAFERGFRRRWRLPAAPAAAGAGLNLIRI